MISQIVPYKRRGKTKPLIGVQPIYGNSGRKILDYKLIPFQGVESSVEPTLANMGIGNTIGVKAQTRYDLTSKGRITTFFALCKNTICTTKEIVWVPLSVLRMRSTISSDTLTIINTFVNNPTSYTIGK